MVGILTPWSKRVLPPDGRVGPAYGNPLLKEAAVLYHGHHNLEYLGRAASPRPTLTGVTPITKNVGRGWSFPGGSEGAADINFGTCAATADLGGTGVPATWAFIALSHVLNETALACHTDANIADGWSVGYHNSDLGIALTRSGANLRVAAVSGISSGRWQADTVYSAVYTFTGVLGAGPSAVSIYLNGLQEDSNGDGDSGSTSPASAESLYLGRRRYDTALSHNGQIFLALISRRLWSETDVRAFHDNPWQVFQRSANRVFSFASSPVAPPVGGKDVVAGQYKFID
jgi:hypothetical protein